MSHLERKVVRSSSLVGPFSKVEKSRRGKNAAYGGSPIFTYQVLDADGNLVATLHRRGDASKDADQLVNALDHWWGDQCADLGD